MLSLANNGGVEDLDHNDKKEFPNTLNAKLASRINTCPPTGSYCRRHRCKERGTIRYRIKPLACAGHRKSRLSAVAATTEYIVSPSKEAQLVHLDLPSHWRSNQCGCTYSPLTTVSTTWRTTDISTWIDGSASALVRYLCRACQSETPTISNLVVTVGHTRNLAHMHVDRRRHRPAEPG
jgi:hypothetical protein